MSNVSMLTEFLTGNWSSDVAPEAGLPLAHLSELGFGKHTLWLATAVQIQCDLDAPRSVGAVYITEHNFEPGDQLRIRCYSDLEKTVESYDSGLIDATPSIANDSYIVNDDPWGVRYDSYAPRRTFWHLFASVACRVLVVEIARGQGAETQIGDLFFGSPWSPVENFAYGADWEEEFNGEQVRMASGSIRTRQGNRWRSISLPFKYLSDDDRAGLLKALRFCGRHNPICVSAYPLGFHSSLGVEHCFVGYLADKKIKLTHEYFNNSSNATRITEG